MKISKTVLNAVGKMSNDELFALNNIVVDAINAKHRAKQLAVKSQFSVGQKVAFDGKRGYVEGTIEKINKVNIVVRSGHTRWTVAPSILSKPI